MVLTRDVSLVVSAVFLIMFSNFAIITATLDFRSCWKEHWLVVIGVCGSETGESSIVFKCLCFRVGPAACLSNSLKKDKACLKLLLLASVVLSIRVPEERLAQ